MLLTLFSAVSLPQIMWIKSLSKDPVTEEMRKANAAWGLPLNVKTTLDPLFIDSPYSIDTIPFYPVTSSTESIEREAMTTPIMKGTLNGHHFVVIKVDYDLSDEQTVKKCPLLKRVSLKHDRKIQETILLVQTYENNLNKYRKKKFSWIQLNERDFPSPAFFDQNFISNKGLGPTPSQKDNFKLLQTLIKTGTGQDHQGLTWTISEK